MDIDTYFFRLRTLAIGALVGCSLLASAPAAAQADSARATERAATEKARATERARMEEDRAAERERAAGERERDRRELRETQRELAEMAARVAEISARLAQEDVRQTLRGGVLTRPVIGVVLEPDDTAGVVISAVSPLGPAREAGLKPGDRLLAVDGKRLDAPRAQARVDQASELLRSKDEGQPVKLQVEREGSRLELAVTPRALPALAALPGDPEFSRRWAEEMARVATPLARFRIGSQGPVVLCADGDDCLGEALLSSSRWNGLRLFPLNPELGRYFGGAQGVLVLESGSDHPLRPGDVLLAVGGQPVNTPTEAMRRLRGGEGDQRELRLRRNGKEQRLQVDALELDLQPLRSLLPPAPPLPPSAPAAPAAPSPAARPRDSASAPAPSPSPSVVARALGR